MTLDIVIMAAGNGTRMKSAFPKVLHKLAGRSLLQHVLDSAAGLGADRIVVITGHGAERVETSVQAPNLRFARQMPQLGTGHAVLQAVPLLHDGGIREAVGSPAGDKYQAYLQSLLDKVKEEEERQEGWARTRPACCVLLG